MSYRTRTYVAGEWDGDSDAIDQTMRRSPFPDPRSTSTSATPTSKTKRNGNRQPKSFKLSARPCILKLET